MQIEHKTEKGTLLFVKTDSELISFNLYEDFGDKILDIRTNKKWSTIRLDINFQLISLTSEITEEMAKMMVDDKHSDFYYDYIGEDKDRYFGRALSSFKSLMQHLQVYEVNPYGKQPFLTDDDAGSEEETQTRFLRADAQQRTGKFIVLFKPH